MKKRILYAVIGVAGCTVIAKVSSRYGAIKQALCMASSDEYHDQSIDAAKRIISSWEQLKERIGRG